MALHEYNGLAFVAFADISGFKKLMKNGKALNCLDDFYQIGYDLFEENSDDNLEGLFVSDCGILIAKTSRDSNLDDKTKVLCSLLNIVKKLNIRMACKGWTLTTSIAYGEYSYRKKIELNHLQKTPIYGGAYVKAFLDSEAENRLKQGECRIVLGEEQGYQVEDIIENLPNEFKSSVVKKGKDTKHRYYYWQISSADEIENYDAEFKMADEAVFNERTRIIQQYAEALNE